MNIKTIKKYLPKFVFTGILISVILTGIAIPHYIDADYVSQKAAKTIKMIVTAYSSTPEQTDDSPLITASNKQVKDGIIANNMLPFGTKIKIPGLYGDKVFTVEDRMNKRMSNYHIDIWMPAKIMALNFGVKTADIEILDN